MPQTFIPYQKFNHSLSYYKLWEPLINILKKTPPLESRGDRPLKMTFEDQLNSLIFFHLNEYDSAKHLIQVLKEDDFAREHIAPKDGIEKSSYSEAISSRGLEQLEYVFNELIAEASHTLPSKYSELGELIAIDGSLIDACLSMCWADYRKGSKKAKVHVGYDINKSIPRKIHLTKGKNPERQFVSQILSPGQTGVLDRGYQEHQLFDSLQDEGKSFVCRIKVNTTKTCIKENRINPNSFVFYDAEVH